MVCVYIHKYDGFVKLFFKKNISISLALEIQIISRMLATVLINTKIL